MRRFITYFNALLLGVILGMMFVAIVDTIPLGGNLVRADCGNIGPGLAFIREVAGTRDPGTLSRGRGALD